MCAFRTLPRPPDSRLLSPVAMLLAVAAVATQLSSCTTVNAQQLQSRIAALRENCGRNDVLACSNLQQEIASCANYCNVAQQRQMEEIGYDVQQIANHGAPLPAAQGLQRLFGQIEGNDAADHCQACRSASVGPGAALTAAVPSPRAPMPSSVAQTLPAFVSQRNATVQPAGSSGMNTLGAAAPAGGASCNVTDGLHTIHLDDGGNYTGTFIACRPARGPGLYQHGSTSLSGIAQPIDAQTVKLTTDIGDVTVKLSALSSH